MSVLIMYPRGCEGCGTPYVRLIIYTASIILVAIRKMDACATIEARAPFRQKRFLNGEAPQLLYIEKAGMSILFRKVFFFVYCSSGCSFSLCRGSRFSGEVWRELLKVKWASLGKNKWCAHLCCSMRQRAESVPIIQTGEYMSYQV